MLLFRRAVSAFSPRARTFLPTAAPFAAPTRSFSVTAWLKEADSKTPSTDAKAFPNTIGPPWQLSDLGWELKLFEQYGPNYIDHVDAKSQELIRKRAAARKQIEESLKAELGDDSDAWYEVMKEANRRQRLYSQSVVQEFNRRKRELGPRRGNQIEEHRRLAKEMRAWSLTGQRQKNLEFRRQVVEERLKQS